MLGDSLNFNALCKHSGLNAEVQGVKPVITVPGSVYANNLNS